jgi:hypothetical protein
VPTNAAAPWTPSTPWKPPAPRSPRPPSPEPPQYPPGWSTPTASANTSTPPATAKHHTPAAPHHTTAPGDQASLTPASLRTDLALARAEIRRLRADNDKLRHRLRLQLGAEIDAPNPTELITRVAELESLTRQLLAERDARAAEANHAQHHIDELEDDLTAARESLRRVIKDHKPAPPANTNQPATSPTCLNTNTPMTSTFQDRLQITTVTTMLDAGVSLRDVQIAARHADPRTTMRYDRARKNLDRHPNYILAAYMASGT